jgi:HPr kinase/phosphorylase
VQGPPEHLHATCVVLGRHGLFIRGRPGIGKSRLALTLLDWAQAAPARRFAALVADDQVAVARMGDSLVARPARALRGLIEVRGIGLLQRPVLPAARLTHLVDLLDIPPERLPEEDALSEVLMGVRLPRLPLLCAPSEALPVLLAGLDVHPS